MAGAGERWPQWAVYDPLGRRIESGAAASIGGGVYHASWSGRDTAGAEVNPGVYFLEVRAGKHVARDVLVRIPD